MQLNLISGLYPDFVGKRSLFVGNGNGPKTYTTGGDPVTVNISPFYIDILFGGVFTVSDTYYVLASPVGIGQRQTWSLIWKVASTNAQVAPGVDLSAEKLQIGGIGGRF